MILTTVLGCLKEFLQKIFFKKSVMDVPLQIKACLAFSRMELMLDDRTSVGGKNPKEGGGRNEFD